MYNKKIFLIGLLIVCLLLPAWAARHAYYPSAPAEGLGQGAALMSSQIAWQVLDETTSAGTEPTDLAVGERTYLTVVAAVAADDSGDGEISYTKVPPTWNGIRIRCIGITNDASVTYQIYAGTKGNETDCELAKVGQLAYTIGTQASITSTYEMADTLTVTAADWTATAGASSPTSNQLADYSINLLGADFIVVVPTVAGCDCKLLIKGY